MLTRQKIARIKETLRKRKELKLTKRLFCPWCKREIPNNLAAAALGRAGRFKTSELKKITARENGKKGGRPKKSLDKN